MSHIQITCNFCGLITQQVVAPALLPQVESIFNSLKDQTGQYAWCEGCDEPRNVGKDYIYEFTEGDNQAKSSSDAKQQ